MKTEPAIRSNILTGLSDSLVFNVSDEMAKKFAELTVDHSSLHTKSMFGRRSIYRETVVHGMLPLMGLAALKIFHPGAVTGTLENLRAIFLAGR